MRIIHLASKVERLWLNMNTKKWFALLNSCFIKRSLPPISVTLSDLNETEIILKNIQRMEEENLKCPLCGISYAWTFSLRLSLWPIVVITIVSNAWLIHLGYARCAAKNSIGLGYSWTAKLWNFRIFLSLLFLLLSDDFWTKN